MILAKPKQSVKYWWSLCLILAQITAKEQRQRISDVIYMLKIDGSC